MQSCHIVSETVKTFTYADLDFDLPPSTPPSMGHRVVKTHLSPRQLAEAVGVSESSVKRWADQGLIPVERTAGGHRRLPVGGVVQFLRGSDLTLVRPELLGLAAAAAGAGAEGGVDAELVEALAAGDEERLRAVVFRLYIGGMKASELCDRHLAGAFHEVGSRWQHGSLEVYQERRGVEICQTVLRELRQAVSAPPAGAPRAAGGTLAGDWYGLPTAMAEVALKEAGWNAQSYGSSHPVETLIAAVREQELRIFWLSLSWIGSLSETATAVERLYHEATRRHTALVLGGRALTPRVRRRLRATAFCDDMTQLQDLAAALEPGGIETPPESGSGEERRR